MTSAFMPEGENGELTRAGRSLYFADARVLDPETGAVLASGQGTYKYR